jgi:hypothetical protein
VGELAFAPDLHHGYDEAQPLEPDLQAYSRARAWQRLSGLGLPLRTSRLGVMVWLLEVSPHYTPCPMGQSQATFCPRSAAAG